MRNQQGDGRSTLFQFAYRSVPFRVVMSDHACTVLQAYIGTMPYTADGPSLRHDMLALLDRARRTAGYEIKVAHDHAINLSVELAIDGAAPPASILAAALEQLAGAKPWLDLVLSLMPVHSQKFAERQPQDAA